MNGARKNILASIGILLLFAAFSLHLAHRHTAHERKLKALSPSHHLRTSKNSGTRSAKPKTVNDLYSKYSQQLSVRELLPLVTLGHQYDPFESWQIATFHLKELSPVELLVLTDFTP